MTTEPEQRLMYGKRARAIRYSDDMKVDRTMGQKVGEAREDKGRKVAKDKGSLEEHKAPLLCSDSPVWKVLHFLRYARV